MVSADSAGHKLKGLSAAISGLKLLTGIMEFTCGSGMRSCRSVFRFVFPFALAPVAAFVPGAALAACNLGKMAELPVTMAGSKPLVTAQINGTDARFIADSGAFYSMIAPASAAQFNLRLGPAPFGLSVRGIGGQADISVTTVKVFTLAGYALRDVQFLVGGSEPGAGSAGVIGQNVLHIGDVEYDLANGAIRLMRPHNCSRSILAYWANATQPYSVMDIQSTTVLSPGTIGTAYVNGVKIRVLFDTGATNSILALRAAEHAGVEPGAAGTAEAGDSYGIGRGTVKTWIAPVADFKIGDEEIRNTRLRIGDIRLDNADMLIGADFFLSHRIYVATSQSKLYFTYNGGPVFNLAASPTARTATMSATETPSTASPPPSTPADEPADAAAYSRRGAAFAARRDYADAIADLSRACELAPDQPEYLYQRGIVHAQNKQPSLAMADFDQAIKLKPDDVSSLIGRAELRLMSRDNAAAATDLDAADRFAPRQADIRLLLAHDYARADMSAPAVAQYDLWIAAHGDDARLPTALNGRCWSKALSGQDLSDALADCNAALKRVPKSSLDSARVLASRGLVRLRMGDFEKSAADFGAALSLRPNDAWCLYGRGLDELRQGKAAAGQADITAATAASPRIADEFKRHGITP
jgi:tetratricopeptide (TPR) repeat protein/predicted aspartyl protease